jgi:hypothetical protein
LCGRGIRRQLSRKKAHNTVLAFHTALFFFFFVHFHVDGRLQLTHVTHRTYLLLSPYMSSTSSSVYDGACTTLSVFPDKLFLLGFKALVFHLLYIITHEYHVITSEAPQKYLDWALFRVGSFLFLFRTVLATVSSLPAVFTNRCAFYVIIKVIRVNGVSFLEAITFSKNVVAEAEPSNRTRFHRPKPRPTTTETNKGSMYANNFQNPNAELESREMSDKKSSVVHRANSEPTCALPHSAKNNQIAKHYLLCYIFLIGNACQLAHATCDEGRPCSRCAKRNISCFDMPYVLVSI